jgi:hypothetical protein
MKAKCPEPSEMEENLLDREEPEDTEDALQDTLLRVYVFKTEMVSGQ